MSLLQLGSLALAFLGPVVLWAMHRRRPHPLLERSFARGIAGMLVVVFAAIVVQKATDGTLTAREALPMQLCDWALIAVVGALLWRSQTCFELGYFWGLCGTLQALFTPAISRDLAWWKQAAFSSITRASWRACSFSCSCQKCARSAWGASFCGRKSISPPRSP